MPSVSGTCVVLDSKADAGSVAGGVTPPPGSELTTGPVNTVPLGSVTVSTGPAAAEALGAATASSAAQNAKHDITASAARVTGLPMSLPMSRTHLSMLLSVPVTRLCPQLEPSRLASSYVAPVRSLPLLVSIQWNVRRPRAFRRRRYHHRRCHAPAGQSANHSAGEYGPARKRDRLDRSALSRCN